jgi:hypothetical protein
MASQINRDIKVELRRQERREQERREEEGQVH